MAYYRLYLDLDEPEDRRLFELFRKANVFGCMIPYRRHPEYPELIVEEDHVLDISGTNKIREYLVKLIVKK